jgi:hypothetical protein
MSLPPDSPGYGESSAPSVDDFDYSFEGLASVTEKFTVFICAMRHLDIGECRTCRSRDEHGPRAKLVRQPAENPRWRPHPAPRAMAGTVQGLRRHDLRCQTDPDLSARPFARAGKRRIDGKEYVYPDSARLARNRDIARLAVNRDFRPPSCRTDCRLACRSSGPGWRIARR